MASNFDFLTGEFLPFREDAAEAERHALTAPRTCAFYARRVLEKTVKWLYACDPGLRMPYQDNLAALIHELEFQKLVAPSRLFSQIKLIHKGGNQAVHSDIRLRQIDGIQLTRAVHHLLSWTVRMYARPAGTVVAVPPFNDALLQEPLNQAKEADKTAAELKRLQEGFRVKDDEFAAAQERLAASQGEIDRLRAEIRQIKEANEQRLGAVSFAESEAQTRDLFIDVLLREAGWDPDGEHVREYEVQEMPTAKGVGFVDYVLWGDNGLPLAVVEAKRTKKDPREGKRQGELYADCLEKITGQRPVIYYTNGYESWL